MFSLCSSITKLECHKTYMFKEKHLLFSAFGIAELWCSTTCNTHSSLDLIGLKPVIEMSGGAINQSPDPISNHIQVAQLTYSRTPPPRFKQCPSSSVALLSKPRYVIRTFLKQTNKTKQNEKNPLICLFEGEGAKREREP